MLEVVVADELCAAVQNAGNLGRVYSTLPGGFAGVVPSVDRFTSSAGAPLTIAGPL